MSDDSHVSLPGWVFKTILAMLSFALFGLYLKMDSQVSQNAAAIDIASRKTNAILHVLNMKMPDVDLPELIDISLDKGASFQILTNAIDMVSEGQEKAVPYLKSEMKFSDAEVGAVFKANQGN